jgi:hypothetical protein
MAQAQIQKNEIEDLQK